MRMLGVGSGGFRVRPGSDRTYLDGRCAEIVLASSGKVVGTFGSVHPEVLSLFELEFPTSAVDIDLQAFLVAGVEGVGDAAAVAAAGIAALDVSDVLAMTAEELRNKDAKELAK